MNDGIPEYNGHHEWVVAVVHRLDEDAILKAHTGAGLDVDESSIALVPPPYCFHCEQLWVAAHDQPCPGDPVDARTHLDLERTADSLERFIREQGG